MTLIPWRKFQAGISGEDPRAGTNVLQHTIQGATTYITIENTIPSTTRLFHVTVTTATYTVLGQDELVGVNRAGAVAITLPTAQVAIKGKAYIINDESGAASSNNITVATQGAETIDGAATYVINGNYNEMGFYSNGTDWFTV